MQIQVQNLAKSYQNKSIFEGISMRFEENKMYGISGKNGSGKSTFLKVLAGFSTPSLGTIEYTDSNSIISKETIFHYISYTAPYIDLDQTVSVSDTLKFHFTLKKIDTSQSIDSIFKMLDFEPNILLSSLSSGMMQRLKLSMALMSQSKILLIDEPTETLDSQGQAWFLDMVNQYSQGKITIIASNKTNDFGHCTEVLNIENFKKISSRLPN